MAMTFSDPAQTMSEASPEERMRALIEAISSYIEMYHGGAVSMVAFDGKMLKVHMSGACDGCRLAPTTLHGWVEGTVRQFFPEIESVLAV
ncbi:MAG: NifU family protein [Anaerolineales bacterium]|nr:NifU family protein [Anaerolineales bacterium]MCB8954831.1 NifU family protein [Ardenticatenales bacterium]